MVVVDCGDGVVCVCVCVVCTYTCMGGGAYASTYVWRSEDSFVELPLFSLLSMFQVLTSDLWDCTATDLTHRAIWPAIVTVLDVFSTEFANIVPTALSRQF